MSFYTVSHWEANSWDPEDEIKAKEAAEKIAQIREQASEEFENTMLSSHMGTVFASN